MTLADPAVLLAVWEDAAGRGPLGRTVTLLAAGTGCTLAEAAAADVGSRDVALAGLLVSLVGPVAATVVSCGGCGERLDVPVDLAAVATLPRHRPDERFEVSCDGAAVGFRLPTSADLAAVTDPAELLARCAGADLPDPVAARVEEAMESVDPAGAIDVAVRCAGCGTDTEAALDVATLLWAEVTARVTRLLHEVAALARAYGWSEAEVTALSARRRAHYLELAGA